MAIWLEDRIPLIPASNTEYTAQQISQLTDSTLGEWPDFAKSAETKTEFNAENCALVIFTSGSSGTPVPINKSFSQLDAEIRSLEQQCSDLIADSTIVGTVSHQHIYGLLFRVLWPLCSNREFWALAQDYWEEILRDVKFLESISLVSSPAHLDRLPPEFVNSEAWLTVQEKTTSCFSSGAPLKLESSLTAKKQLNCNIYEVYGSSETGGIAWRVQADNKYWQCFEDIEVSARK